MLRCVVRLWLSDVMRSFCSQLQSNSRPICRRIIGKSCCGRHVTDCLASTRCAAGSQRSLMELAQQAAAAVEASDPAASPQASQQLQVTEADIDDVIRKTNRKGELPTDPAVRERIRQRILASMQRKAAKLKLVCPACGVTVTKVEGLSKHTARCCPDILSADAVKQCAQSNDQATLQQLLQTAAAMEKKLRRRAIEITFLAPDEEEHQQQQPNNPNSSSSDSSSSQNMATLDEDEELEVEEQAASEAAPAAAAAPGDGVAPAQPPPSKSRGHRIKTGPTRIAAELGLPLRRCEMLLRQAMANIPLVHDSSRLEVLYEDDDFIAVNKPAGYQTAPVHRWQGGSMVNLLLAHLAGHGSRCDKPYVLHRLDQDTSGVLLFAKRAEVVAGVAQQFRQREVSKEYLAIILGVPPTENFTVNAAIDRHPTMAIARVAVPPPPPQQQQQKRPHGAGGPSETAAVGPPPSTGTLPSTPSPQGSQPPSYGSTTSSSSSSSRRQQLPSTDAKPALTMFWVEAAHAAADPMAAATPGELFAERGRGLREQQQQQQQQEPVLAAAAGVPAVSAAATTLSIAAATAATTSNTAAAAAAGSTDTSSSNPTGTGPLQGAALVRCFPKTGRTHQIRLHLAYIGHPILGDAVYGVTGPWTGRQALHAAALEITHPVTGQRMRFAAPMPPDFHAALAELGFPQRTGPPGEFPR